MEEEKEIVEEEIAEQLTPRQELFCKFYASEREFFGNGVKSYMHAYPDATYNSSKANAYKLLTNTYILRRINQLLEGDVLNDANADKQLGFVMQQHVDFGAKMKAINEYNKLKQRIIEKSEHKVVLEDNTNDSYITKIAQEAENKLKEDLKTNQDENEKVK